MDKSEIQEISSALDRSMKQIMQDMQKEMDHVYDSKLSTLQSFYDGEDQLAEYPLYGYISSNNEALLHQDIRIYHKVPPSRLRSAQVDTFQEVFAAADQLTRLRREHGHRTIQYTVPEEGWETQIRRAREQLSLLEARVALLDLLILSNGYGDVKRNLIRQTVLTEDAVDLLYTYAWKSTGLHPKSFQFLVPFKGKVSKERSWVGQPGE